jgi:hypothetical protein
MRKFVALLFIAVLAVSSLVVVGSVFAQSPPEPSVPEFTVKFVNASYTVTTTNSYTGVDENEQVSNNSVEITITNQPFSHQDYQICYNVRVKPRFEENWTEVYPVRRRTSAYLGDSDFSYAEYINDYSPLQSESDYSTIVFHVVPTTLDQASGYDIRMYYWGAPGQESEYHTLFSAIPDDSQLDFQVAALVGHDSQVWIVDSYPLSHRYYGDYKPAIAYDTTSSWSITQTITIGENQTPSPPPSEQGETQLSEQAVVLGVAAIVAVFASGLVLLYRIKRK